jgi:hypothetical protein
MTNTVAGGPPAVPTLDAVQTGLTGVSLYADYIYLDTDERRRFAQVSHEYLIEQLQYNEYSSTAGSDSHKLNFNHPVKELVWVTRGATNSSSNQWCNYTIGTAVCTGTETVSFLDGGSGGGQLTAATFAAGGTSVATTPNAHGLIVGEALWLITFAGANTAITSGNVYYVQSVVDATNFTISSAPGGATITSPNGSNATAIVFRKAPSIPSLTTAHYFQTGGRVPQAADGNPTTSAILKLNGHDRFSVRNGRYFNKCQPEKHHTNIPESPGINVYSFALKPEDHQPSGTCNFSRIDNAQLNIVSGIAGVTKIFAVNYNVLRIMSGMGGLAYSN